MQTRSAASGQPGAAGRSMAWMRRFMPSCSSRRSPSCCLVRTAVTQIARREGFAAADAARLASYGTGLLSVGTILGCVVLPIIAERFGRRATMGLYFTLMGASVAVAFGYVF